jgi:hypothetical protein
VPRGQLGGSLQPYSRYSRPSKQISKKSKFDSGGRWWLGSVLFGVPDTRICGRVPWVLGFSFDFLRADRVVHVFLALLCNFFLLLICACEVACVSRLGLL